MAEMKALIKVLNAVCRRALESAAGACIQRTHYEITIEHMLAPLLDAAAGSTDLLRIAEQAGADIAKVRAAIQRTLDELKTGNSGRPQYSPFLAEWLSEGYQICSLELGARSIRSGGLLLALLRHPNRAFFIEYTEELNKISAADLKNQFAKLTADSSENDDAAAGAAGPAAPGGGAAFSGAPGEALQQFTSDLTAKAREGRIDPVIGREKEIRQCVDILMRRYQNNPLILGEPGTGKTAIAEGLALRVAQGDVPEFLRNITIRALDVGLLSAGASVKGEFERRLKGVIQEVHASNAAGKPIILFIDEAHTLIGGGGGGDAAQLLKPALARGELRTVAATTSAEYKKYFEKDPPFAQRFGLIRLEEPSVPVAIEMLRGTKDKFEGHHHVRILDEAIRIAVTMSNQYLSEAQLPRKAVSLLDTAAARVAVGLSTTPGALEDIRRRIIQIDTATRAIERDVEAGHKHDPRELEDLRKERSAQQAEYDALEARWKEERALAREVIALRAELGRSSDDATMRRSDGGEDGNSDAATKRAGGMGLRPESLESTGDSPRPTDQIRADLAVATKRLEEYLAKRAPLIPLHVDGEIVAQVLSDWTGIPVGSMVKDQAGAILTFEEKISGRVIGQDHALTEIGKRLRIASGKLQDPNLPLAVFFLVGPSGTGKTETALAVADLIFGGERFMTTINMTEYSSSMNVSRLIGSAPGLVGFGEGGVLTEAVRKRPYSVILLDEMEKAHMDVNLLFMQVFDKGSLTDSEGRAANFKNTVIIMTSNEGADMIMDMTMEALSAGGSPPTLEEMRTAIQPILEKRFTPAFVGRTTVIPFYPLSQATLRKIIDLKLSKIRRRLQETYRLGLDIDPAVGDAIAARCQQITIGARLINQIINETVLPEIARRILMTMGEEERKYQALRLGMGGDGAFSYEFV